MPSSRYGEVKRLKMSDDALSGKVVLVPARAERHWRRPSSPSGSRESGATVVVTARTVDTCGEQVSPARSTRPWRRSTQGGGTAVSHKPRISQKSASANVLSLKR